MRTREFIMAPSPWQDLNSIFAILSTTAEILAVFLAIISTIFRLSLWRTYISAALWRRKSKNIELISHFPSLWAVGLSSTGCVGRP